MVFVMCALTSKGKDKSTTCFFTLFCKKECTESDLHINDGIDTPKTGESNFAISLQTFRNSLLIKNCFWLKRIPLI